MAIEVTPEPPDPNETSEVGEPSEFDRWEAKRNAELRGEEPPKDEPKPSEAPAAPKAGEPKKAESAGDPEPPEKKQEQDTDTDPDKKADADKKPGKSGVQKRFDKLTREKYEAQQHARKLEERIAALEAKPAGDKPAGDKPEKPDKPDAEGEPDPNDFGTYEEYSKALFKFMSAQEKKAATEAEQRTRDEEVQRTVFDNWTNRLDASREAHEDFDEVTDAEIPLTPAMQQAMLDSEQGAELAYYLGKNPEEAERIAQLSPVGTVRELLRIEATFGKPEATKKPDDPAPKPKTVSKAPPPVNPVRGGGGHAADLHDPTLAFSDWENQRNAEILAGQR